MPLNIRICTTAIITITTAIVFTGTAKNQALGQEASANQATAAEANASENLNRDSSEDMLRHALALQEQQTPQNPEKLAETRLALATSLKYANKHAAARELAELALDAQEKLFGKGDKRFKLALMLLSSIYLDTNRKQFNEKEIASLEGFLTSLAEMDREQAASLRVQLAQIYLGQDKPKEAENQWYQCTAMLHNNLPPDCRDLAQACKEILQKLASDKQFDDAQALARGMAEYGFNQDVLISAANGFVVLSQQQESLGNEKKAEHLAKRALQTAEKYGDRKTCSYTSAIKQYAATLRKQGKEKKAKSIEKRAIEVSTKKNTPEDKDRNTDTKAAKHSAQ